jgi:hypothetical protein
MATQTPKTFFFTWRPKRHTHTFSFGLLRKFFPMSRLCLTLYQSFSFEPNQFF